MLDLTNLVEAIIALVSAAITAFLIPWLKNKYGTETLEKARALAQIAVYAAEKVYGAGNGDQKLAYVESFLAEKKVKLDTKTIKAMIESEVKKMELLDPAKYIAETALEFEDVDATPQEETEEEAEEETETPEAPGVIEDGV